MIKTIIDGLLYCCFGKLKNKEIKLIHKVKNDVKELTKEELDHLKNFLLKDHKQYCC